MLPKPTGCEVNLAHIPTLPLTSHVTAGWLRDPKGDKKGHDTGPWSITFLSTLGASSGSNRKLGLPELWGPPLSYRGDMSL